MTSVFEETRNGLVLSGPAALYESARQGRLYLRAYAGARYARMVARPLHDAARTFPALIAATTPVRGVTVVDLGPGASMEAQELIDAITSLRAVTHYTAVDINRDLARAAARAVIASHPRIEVAHEVGEFETPRWARAIRRRPAVFVLGSTFMNYTHAALLPILRRFMRRGDVLCASALLRGKKRESALTAYTDANMRAFLFEPIARAGGTTNNFEFAPRLVGGDIQLSWRALRQSVLADGVHAWSVSAGQRVTVGISRRPALRVVQSWLQRRFRGYSYAVLRDAVVAFAAIS